MTARGERERVHLETAAQLRDWLEENHASSPGIWLVSWRRRTGRPSIPYEDTVREALCVGWIDGQIKQLDDDRTMLHLAPRSPRSGWAGTNKARVAELTTAGRMRPAGLAAIEAAKANGTWNALDESESGVVSPDLAAALAGQPAAQAAWETWPPSTHRMSLAWIYSAKRPETRARRIEELVSRAAAGRRPFEADAPGAMPRPPRLGSTPVESD
jgi:uncharacterized protein YdeI (YjbR/CyaY-like superfamily)